MCPHNIHFYRTFLHKQASWVIMKKGAVKATICIFQKSFFVMSPNAALLQSQRDESIFHRAARRGNHPAPNEGKVVGLPKWRCNKTACLTDG